MCRIMDACKAARGRVGHVQANLFWPALISFIFDTAERIGAVLEVRRGDLSGEWVTVRGEFRKGGKRDARYKLRKETLELLDRIKVDGQELIFHWPLDRNYIYNRFGRLLEAADLPNTPRNKFHKIRRTTASFYQAAGCDATRLLGHSNQRVTKASYLDPSIVKTAQPADIVAGIGQTEKPKEETDSQEELLDQFREFLRQKGSSS